MGISLKKKIGSLKRVVSQEIILHEAQRKWCKAYPNSLLGIGTPIDPSVVTFGKYTYGRLNILSSSPIDVSSHLTLGNFDSIGPDVCFLLGAEHPLNLVSTYPFKHFVLEQKIEECQSKGDIVVGDDVWIGRGAQILSGIKIGQGAVVAAGSIVTKDVPPYAIVGGNPAKIIRFRYGDALIAELMKVDYSKLTKEMIEQHQEDLYRPLTDSKQLDWMPKK
jgi:virginiamycin A acetyltransferase